MKIGRKYTQGFCIKPDYWGGQAPPSEILGGPVAPLAPLVPTPLKSISAESFWLWGTSWDLKLQSQ